GRPRSQCTASSRGSSSASPDRPSSPSRRSPKETGDQSKSGQGYRGRDRHVPYHLLAASASFIVGARRTMRTPHERARRDARTPENARQTSPRGPRTASPWSRRLLGTFSHLTTTYARTVVVLVCAVSVLAAWYTWRHLDFLTSRNQLISSDKRYLQLDDAY